MQVAIFQLGHRPALDGLRGFAVICVMIFHAHTGYLEGGGLGVEVFFVLSGFLITTLVCNEFDVYGNVSLKNFFARRALRLMPALALVVAVFCVLSVLLLDRAEATDNLIDGAISLAYFTNWARAFSIHPPDLLGHTWSLSIEEQFYLVWPLVLLLLLRVTKSRGQMALAAIGLALCSQIWRIYLLHQGARPERLFNGLDTRADALMIGCALALLFSRAPLEDIRRRLGPTLQMLGPLALLFLCWMMWRSGITEWRRPYMFRWGFAVAELCAAAVIAHLVINGSGMLARLFTARWLRWAGAISYGLYLWHYPIYRTMRANGASALEILTLGSAATLIIAMLSFQLLEKPVLRKLKPRFERHRSGTAGVEARPAGVANAKA